MPAAINRQRNARGDQAALDAVRQLGKSWIAFLAIHTAASESECKRPGPAQLRTDHQSFARRFGTCDDDCACSCIVSDAEFSGGHERQVPGMFRMTARVASIDIRFGRLADAFARAQRVAPGIAPGWLWE
jgi:hypothetical protein